MKSKLKRFEIISNRENVIEPGKEIFLKIKGKWNVDYFNRDKPITLELACGRGEYSVGMAKLFPDRNFIGVDKKGDRLWKGSTWAVEDQLNNVAFLRTEILFMESFIESGEVDEIWLTFPDPRPKLREELALRNDLEDYQFTHDLYNSNLRPECYDIKTRYEEMFAAKGEKIKYLRLRFKQ